MATFSTLEALADLTKKVPEWSNRLDELNGQIAQRQLDLARLTESPAPAVRSIKHKGSTESLRPKDKDQDNDDGLYLVDEELGITASPVLSQSGFVASRIGSPTAIRAAMAEYVDRPDSSPMPVLKRESSVPNPPTQTRLPAKLRKTKTESMASGEAKSSAYRTRSMIIVYYDSAVQTAFEDLVKFVSANRNAMRKGKMAAKMEEMKRAADLEVEALDGQEDEDEAGLAMDDGLPSLSSETPAELGSAAYNSIPRLRFMSTRRMGPSHDQLGSNSLSLAVMKGYRRSGADAAPDIFDELDKGLEWCQSQCEHAAHQFLRDGDCTTQIENIKRKLDGIRAKAEEQIDELEKQKEKEKEGKEHQKEPVSASLRTLSRTSTRNSNRHSTNNTLSTSLTNGTAGTENPAATKAHGATGEAKKQPIMQTAMTLEVDSMELDAEPAEYEPPQILLQRDRARNVAM